MMATLLAESCSQSMTLLWGLRSESDRYYLQELEAWKSRHENFSYVLTLSQPSSTWKGNKGRVTELLQELTTVKDSAAYVCGNRAMVKEVMDLLKKKGAGVIYRERHSESA
jgi:NAD(P)H-flavin reductase